MLDIYFDKNYGKLYEKAENGVAEIFELKTKNGTIVNQFIKRKIPTKISQEVYYDIVTPYGYGGPIIKETSNKSALLREYEKKFSKYCQENKIVSEFVRFHPILNNALDFEKIYNAEHIRQTLGTNIQKYEDPVQSEFSKSCRKNIRRCINKGITTKVTESPKSLGDFKAIYYSTMDRNNAESYYYFDDSYFESILKYFPNNIITVEAIYENRTIAMGLYFIYNKVLHIHLSGTLSEYLHLHPAYMLRYAATKWAKEHNYELIHHGGGRSNSANDSLFMFKKGFAQNTEFDFYIGRKVWDNITYNKLCDITNTKNETNYFPAYRRALK